MISRDNQEQEEYKVKEILDSRIKGHTKQFEYCVRWFVCSINVLSESMTM